MPYTKEELELLDAVENGELQSVDFDNDVIKAEAKKTEEYLKQKNRLVST